MLTQSWLAVQTNAVTPLNLQAIRFFDSGGNPDAPSGVRVLYTGNNSPNMYRTVSGSPTGIGTGTVLMYISPQVSLTGYQWCRYVIKY